MKEPKLFPEFEPASDSDWEAAIRQELKGKDFESLIRITEEGFKLRPFYAKETSSSQQVPVILRHSKEWQIMEDIAVVDLKSAKQKAHEALSLGAGSINFIVDKIADKAELELLLKGIFKPLVSIHVSCKQDPLLVLNWLKEIFSERKVLKKISGSFNFNPFESQFARNEVKEMMNFLSGFSSDFYGIFISSFDEKLITNQVSNALGKGNTILKTLINDKFSIDDVAARIMFSFPVSNNYFFEISKIRAMRILWRKVISRYNPSDVNSSLTFIHAAIKSDYDVEKNMQFISNTSRLMSAAIGGADIISIESPDDFSQKINRNIQLIAKEESYLNQVEDAAAGSYYIEYLTDQIATKAWQLFTALER